MFFNKCLWSKRRHQKREVSFTPTVAIKAFEPAIDFSLPGKVVVEHLEGLFKRYGPPRVIRCDDGSEFKSKHFCPAPLYYCLFPYLLLSLK